MLENLETLLELHKQGTMSQTSTVLRISQSAVSKRIAAVEAYYGTKLIEKSGRNVCFTKQAVVLVERLRPLLIELREAVGDQKKQVRRKLTVGVSESILSSWGAVHLERVFKKNDFEVEYHSHRSPVVIEKVESAIYDIGLCAGKVSNPRIIISEMLKAEELVLIADHPQSLKNLERPYEIMSIERSSATAKSIQDEIRKRNLKVSSELESFFAIAQLAKAGRGIGLVPIGVAETLGFRSKNSQSLKPKLFRPIQIVYKKSKLDIPNFHELIAQLKRMR
ncbi:MAG: LysR family transcriptional regulator [Bdellovibrionales bacterium]|nr:LysR family transcriptional regulator [Bdellovibrionales bacterium]